MDNQKRNELILEIASTIDKIQLSETKTVNAMYKYMELQLKHKMRLGKIKLAIHQPSSLAVLDTSELYAFASKLKEFCDTAGITIFRVDLEEYFSKEEISTSKLMRLRTADNDSEINVLKMRAMQKGSQTNPEWIGIMSYEEIVDASKRGLLKYNMATQRVAKVFVVNGKTRFIPDIDEKTVDKIAQAIIEERFEPNTITLNILKTEDEPYYNEYDKDNILEIDADQNEIDIIDGMHRIKGIVKAWQIREKQIIDGEESKQISGTMAVCVKNISEEQAKTFIHQESLANSQQKSTKLLYSPDSLLAQFFFKLNKARGSVAKNPYYGKISAYMGDNIVISSAFAASFLADMNVVYNFDKKVNKESALVDTVDNFISFANIVYENFKDRDDYKKNKQIFEGQCFMVGLISYFFNNLDKTDISKEATDAFIGDAIDLTPDKFVFDYPLTSRALKELRQLYK